MKLAGRPWAAASSTSGQRVGPNEGFDADDDDENTDADDEDRHVTNSARREQRQRFGGGGGEDEEEQFDLSVLRLTSTAPRPLPPRPPRRSMRCGRT